MFAHNVAAADLTSLTITNNQPSLEELKREINNFVWMFGSDELTLREADEIALKILDLLRPEFDHEEVDSIR